MKTRQLILTGLFAALTAISALIAIPLPFSPVPLTMQIFFTLLAGLILGSRWGAVSQLVYLMLGGIGLPVFAGGSAGFDKLVGPTAGYLWGFVLAAFVVGLIAERRPSAAKDLLALAVGLLMIYIPGTFDLAKLTGLTLMKAFSLGVLPFVIGDLAKMAMVFICSQQMRKRLSNLHHHQG